MLDERILRELIWNHFGELTLISSRGFKLGSSDPSDDITNVSRFGEEQGTPICLDDFCFFRNFIAIARGSSERERRLKIHSILQIWLD